METRVLSLSWIARRTMLKLGVRLIRATGWYDGYFNHWRTFFDDIEAEGIHLMPVHYYSPVPEVRGIDPDVWQRRSPLPGLQFQSDHYLSLLKEFSRRFGDEYAAFQDASTSPAGFYLYNNAFSSGDAEVLFCMVRSLRPRRIVEIGAGFSTLVTASALRRNYAEDSDYCCSYTVIEPFPERGLKAIREISKIAAVPVQEVALHYFEDLSKDDILFIDSSHVAKIGSDVVFEYLDVFPRLKAGVHIHAHDIFIPADYPPRLVRKGKFFWNEQYLLHAFLAFNPEFEVMWPGHFMHLMHSEELRKVFPGYADAPIEPSSFWMRRRSDA